MTHNYQPMKQTKKDIRFRYEVHVSYPLSIKANLIYKEEKEFESKILLGTHCSFDKVYNSDRSLPEFSVHIHNNSKIDYRVYMNLFIQDQPVLFREVIVNNGSEFDTFHLNIPLNVFKKYTRRIDKNLLFNTIKRTLLPIKFW
jgi:hypothetical protein